MGLEEKRAVENFKNNLFPDLKKEIEDAAGFAVSIEASWDKLITDGYSHLYNDAFTKVYFTPLINALKAITIDDMGRNALKNSLKKIIITKEKDNHSCNNFTYNDGILVIDHKPVANIDDVDERSDGIQKLIEGKL
jgi:hypothetical protein